MMKGPGLKRSLIYFTTTEEKHKRQRAKSSWHTKQRT